MLHTFLETPGMKSRMNSIGIVCVQVADCKAYLYATAAAVVSPAPVAWVVSLSSAWGNQRFSCRGQIVTANVSSFHSPVNGTTVQDNKAVFCMKRKWTDCLKL